MRRTTGSMLLAALITLGGLAMDVSAAEHKLTGDNTKIEFVGTKKDGKHSGSFPKLSGTFDLGDDATKAKISVTIDMEGLESDDPKLTGHLKSPDFFETKKYPDAKFVSKTIKSDKEGYTVTGDLTMHGKTKEISFPAKITKADGGASLTSEFKIKRSDWGMTWGTDKVDDAAQLTVKIKAK